MGLTKDTHNDSTGKVYQLHVALKDVDPPIWRRIIISEDASLEDLHVAVQLSMGWENVHLHEFRIGDIRYRPSSIAIDTPFEEGEDTSSSLLKALNLKMGSKIDYLYDFGDGWKHQIVVEDILVSQDNIEYPVCIAGERACPMEDCGGAIQFTDLLKGIEDPKHPRHAEATKMFGKDFDFDYFDTHETNELLRLGNGFKKKVNSAR